MTLNIYAQMFDEARHAADIRARMARSACAGLLESDEDERTVIVIRRLLAPRRARCRLVGEPRSSGVLDQNLTKPGQVDGKGAQSLV